MEVANHIFLKFLAMHLVSFLASVIISSGLQNSDTWLDEEKGGHYHIKFHRERKRLRFPKCPLHAVREAGSLPNELNSKMNLLLEVSNSLPSQ